jgi:hypothetical protein
MELNFPIFAYSTTILQKNQAFLEYNKINAITASAQQILLLH